jgi:hypothetical protein
MNLRSYYPDFVAVDKDGTHWLIEAKGAETAEVVHKDSAAKNGAATPRSSQNPHGATSRFRKKAFVSTIGLEHLRALEPAVAGSL